MPRPRKHPRRRKFGWSFSLLIVAAVLVFALAWSPGGETSASLEDTVSADVAGEASHPVLSRQALVQGMIQDPTPEPRPRTLYGTIQSGDTAWDLFGSWLSDVEVVKLANACRDVHSLRRLKPGRPYAVQVLDGRLEGFEYEVDAGERLVVERGSDGFEAWLEPIPYDVKTVTARGTIDSSLIEAMAEAGEETALALKLADIFAWDVDFCRDIREGDAFECLVEKRYRNGAFEGYGPILAARFVNRGEAFEGFRFPDEKGQPSYFNPEGDSLRKVLLKAPLSFRRISSGFSHRRFHPILKYYRPHTGVDYAAPTGTPVWSVGDGKVIRRGRTRAAGNYVRIRHNGMYTTQYNHLSRFARGTRPGSTVTQGQTIGYVGSTGYATGPHLDYRLYYRGKPIDPRKVKAPSCKPVPSDRREEFQAEVRVLRAALDSQQEKVRLADVGPEEQ